MTVIYVDADACPVKPEVVRVATRHKLRVVFVTNMWMRLPDEWDAELVWLASETGFAHAYAGLPVSSTHTRSEVLVGRIDVTPDAWPIEFHLKIVGAYAWLGSAVALKRRLFGKRNS